MNNEQEQNDKGRSPGSGAGPAGNPQPRQHEEAAVKRTSNFPGNEEHAAGMNNRNQDKKQNNPLLDWGDAPASGEQQQD